jgi:large subunit ribosomal protein L29
MPDARALRQKTDRELTEFLQESRRQLAELSLKAAAKQLPDVRAIRTLKRDIARSLTVWRERRRLKS